MCCNLLYTVKLVCNFEVCQDVLSSFETLACFCKQFRSHFVIVIIKFVSNYLYIYLYQLVSFEGLNHQVNLLIIIFSA